MVTFPSPSNYLVLAVLIIELIFSFSKLILNFSQLKARIKQLSSAGKKAFHQVGINLIKNIIVEPEAPRKPTCSDFWHMTCELDNSIVLKVRNLTSRMSPKTTSFAVCVWASFDRFPALTNRQGQSRRSGLSKPLCVYQLDLKGRVVMQLVVEQGKVLQRAGESR